MQQAANLFSRMNALVALRDTALRRRNALDEEDEQDKSLVGQAVVRTYTEGVAIRTDVSSIQH